MTHAVSAEAGVDRASAASPVLAAIRTRRSTTAFLPEPPAREDVDALLGAANVAPNHGLTQPWRFFVLKGEARRRLGEALAEDVVSHAAPIDAAADRAMREATVHKLLRAPVVVVVATVPPAGPRFPFWEELAATAAAVQNLLLAASALGLASHWRSNTTAMWEVKRLLGLDAEAQVVGLVNIGYADPAVRPAEKRRRPHAELTRWLGWDEPCEVETPASW